MIQIRQGVFETNSSSTHSITIASESDFDKWKNGDVYLNDGWWGSDDDPNKDKTFLTRDEAINLLESSGSRAYRGDWDDMCGESLDEELSEWGIYTFENYWNDYLEHYENHYATEHGDAVVVLVNMVMMARG